MRIVIELMIYIALIAFFGWKVALLVAVMHIALGFVLTIWVLSSFAKCKAPVYKERSKQLLLLGK